MSTSAKTPNTSSTPTLPVQRSLRRRQAILQGASLRPQSATLATSTAPSRDVFGTPRLTLNKVRFAELPLSRAGQSGVALREVAQTPATSPAIVSRATSLWQSTPRAQRNAHPTSLIVAHALMAAPEQHEAMLAELEAQGVLSAPQRVKLSQALSTLASQPGRPVTAIVAPDAFASLLAALPFPVAEALVLARGKAIQEQLDSWSEDLREQAKIDAEVQKKANEAAQERQRHALSHRLAQYQTVRTRVARTLHQTAMERALVRLAQVSAQPEVYGATRLSSDVPYATRVVRSSNAALPHDFEVSEESAAASLRALSPTTLRAALNLAHGEPVQLRPYTPNYAAALSLPSWVAQGPSLRQPSHALEAVDLPGRGLI